jgi:hypothetical protein
LPVSLSSAVPLLLAASDGGLSSGDVTKLYNRILAFFHTVNPGTYP